MLGVLSSLSTSIMGNEKIYANGSKYVGEWHNFKRHGEGELRFPDGSYYKGHWENDKKNGQGFMRYYDISRYQGNWKDDKRDGLGRMDYINGGIYKGNWKNDKRDGLGKMKYYDGSIYEGEFKDDNRDGEGTFIQPHAGKEFYIEDSKYNDTDILKKYSGNWKDDQRNGKGIQQIDYIPGIKNIRIARWNFTYNGNWESDMKSDEGIQTDINGRYKGQWKYDKRDGMGEMTFKDNSAGYKVYNGEWKNGKMNGRGKMTWTDGITYEGGWTDDQMNGRGKMTWPSGHVRDGLWINNTFSDNTPLLSYTSVELTLPAMVHVGSEPNVQPSSLISGEVLDWSNEFIPALLPDGVRNDIFLLDEDDIDINVYMGHLGI
jgi:hypothetical protein